MLFVARRDCWGGAGPVVEAVGLRPGAAVVVVVGSVLSSLYAEIAVA